MLYRYRLVEVIPNVYCLRYEKGSEENKDMVFKGLAIKKELGKYNSFYDSLSHENILDKINFFSIRTCITKIRLLDLANGIYTTGIEVFRNGAFDIEKSVNWKPIWSEHEE